MNNFGRSLKLALRYRWTLVGSVLAALAVAVLWGGNIGAVYPLVEISLKGETLRNWSERQVDGYRKQVADDDAELARLGGPDASNAARHLAASRESHAAMLRLFTWLDERVIVPYLDLSPFATLVLVIGVLLVGTLIKSVFLVINQVLVTRLSSLAVMDLRKEFFRKSLRCDLGRFTADGTGELMSRFTYDMENLLSAHTEFYGKLVREPLKMLACLAGAAFVSWRLLLFSMILAPPAVYLIRKLAKALKRANRKLMEEMSEMYEIIDETFQGIKVVKAFTMERHERRRFHESNKEFYKKSMRIGRYDALTRPLTEVLGIGTICVALLAGAYLVLNQATHIGFIKLSNEPISLSMMFVFYGMLAGTSDPARKLSEVFSRLQRGAAAADRIYQLLDREPTVVNPAKPVNLPRHARDLVFENVSFAYTPDRPVLENVSLAIRAGETIAIVGPNGCGKSTLANLVPRFFDPTSGRVLLDGVDIRDARMQDLRGQIGIVAQETLLFDDTVLNNIRYGSPRATREQVVAAAEQAHAHRFIEEKLSAGYETVVGERGNKLSGGQRQRIALARAILRDPAILILDEATSQVDLESEQVIHRVLERFVRDRTTVIITHRLSTLALADRIVVMNAGQILDVGTHAELLGRCEFYRRLHELQFHDAAA
ncbi:MAG: ABC transporter ATP-binding protein [Planctomycetales bacterium]|nr:ABC transporter ATP-binding protein [Planctomycetales bacterium]MBN8625732.1 ABC transporter ATP-binding protein [Planctomycetota bacterium]